MPPKEQDAGSSTAKDKTTASSVTSSRASMFAKKQNPLIAFLMLDPAWCDHIKDCQSLADKFVEYAKTFDINSSVNEILTSKSGPTKIYVMTLLNPLLAPIVIETLRTNYTTPLTEKNKEQLYNFYLKENGLLSLIKTAVGSDVVDDFIASRKVAPRF